MLNAFFSDTSIFFVIGCYLGYKSLNLPAIVTDEQTNETDEWENPFSHLKVDYDSTF